MRECHSRVTELTVEGIGECVRNGHHLPGTNLDGPSETTTSEEEDYQLRVFPCCPWYRLMAHFERPIDWKTKKKKFIVMMILFGPDKTILIQEGK